MIRNLEARDESVGLVQCKFLPLSHTCSSCFTALRASLLRAAAAAELKMLYFIQIHVQK